MAVFDLGDTPILTEILEPNDANVSITIFDLSNNTATALNSNSCIEVVASAAAYRYTVDFTNKPESGDNYYTYYMKGSDDIPRWGEFTWSENRANYNEVVHIDTTGDGTNTTDYPAGTYYMPVDNLADALTIADRVTANEIVVTGNLTLTAAVSGRTLRGTGYFGQYDLFLNGQNSTNTNFNNFNLQGTMTGYSYGTGGWLSDINNLEGIFDSVAIGGTLNVKTNSSFYLNGSANQSTSAITINVPGTTTVVAFRAFEGYVQLGNMVGAEIAITGRFYCILLPTCATGTNAFIGAGRIINLSGMTSSNYMMPAAVWCEQSMTTWSAYTGSAADYLNFVHNIEGGRWHITGNQMIFYEDDNSTTVATFNLFKNTSATSSDPDERKRV